MAESRLLTQMFPALISIVENERVVGPAVLSKVSVVTAQRD